MKNRLAVICAGILAVLLLVFLVAFNHQKPRVLVLHGFSEEGPWEQAFDAGFRRGLEHNRQPLSVRWRYMMYSQYLSDRQWVAASQRSREIIDNWQPDVLVTVGEEAQDYVGRYYAGQASPRVVYIINENPALFDYPGAANVTGVHEVLPLGQIGDILQFMGRSPLRIRAIGVEDPTGRAEAQQVQAHDWGPHQFLGVDLATDAVDWRSRVLALTDQVDILLVLSAGGLPESPDISEDINPDQLSGWTAKHAKPLSIGIRESFVIGGGALAVVPSPGGLGHQAAQQTLLALQAIQSAQALPPPKNSQDYLIALRPDELAARGLKLPEIYLQAARGTHTLYPKYGEDLGSSGLSH
ncbi:hypothetical protein [Castellaniella sp.]|uniref:hypothetical protein n=1 Tax=Castellaniella sp. TaxID=1955812 RepID=UPI002AFFDD57|nr:hypothetical protein [Castellaniella sp.]